MGDLTPDYRRGPWVFCVLDEPRVLDVRHEKAGLIVDGGEVARSLLSPFIVAPGPEPDSVEAMPEEKGSALRLAYGEDVCAVRLIDRGDAELGIVEEVEHRSNRMFEGRLPMVPKPGQIVRLSTGDAIPLGEQPFAWSVPGKAGLVEHGGWRLLLPGGSRVEWPVFSGEEASIEQARMVVVMPFPPGRDRYEMVLQVM